MLTKRSLFAVVCINVMQSVADSPEVLSLRNKLLTLKDSKNYAKNYYDMKNTLIDPAVVAEAAQ